MNRLVNFEGTAVFIDDTGTPGHKSGTKYLSPDRKTHVTVIINNNNLKVDTEAHNLFQLSKKYKPFWDIANGQTLCKDCHSLTKRKKLC